MEAHKTEGLKLELGSVIKFLVAEKCKLCDVYGEACFS